jgi:hypothetical protein
LTSHAAAFKRALENATSKVQELFGARCAASAATENDVITLVTIHHARTQAPNIVFKLRAYSHAWLTERGFPSGLPDKLRPKAQRMYPRIVDAVGIAVKTPPWRRELGKAIQKAMSDVVEDCYANGDTDPVLMRARMTEARMKVLRGD